MTQCLVAIDPGEKNIGVSYFDVHSKQYLGSKLLSMNYDEFKVWVSRLYPLIVVIEQQKPQSTYCRLVNFLDGFCYARNIPFYRRRLQFGYNITYRERKQKSIDLFLLRNNASLTQQNMKLDDIADSFNLGFNFLYKK